VKNVIIIVLSLLVIGLGSYVIFDKIIDKKIDNDTKEIKTNTEQDDNKENNIQISNDDKAVAKLKESLTNNDWINENLYSKENVFGNFVDRNEQELKFEVLRDSKSNPIVIVEDISYDKALIVCYKVFVENESVIVKNITGDIGHSGHMHFGIDKNQGLVIYNWMHMGDYSFKAYDVKEKEITIYDEYNCNTGECDGEYKGDKKYNVTNISIELNKENIEKYVK